jgi:hypothetical protein
MQANERFAKDDRPVQRADLIAAFMQAKSHIIFQNYVAYSCSLTGELAPLVRDPASPAA